MLDPQKNHRRKSRGFREQLRIGGEIAAQMGPPLASQAEIAEQLGISQPMVNRLERLALYKVATRYRQMLVTAENAERALPVMTLA